MGSLVITTERRKLFNVIPAQAEILERGQVYFLDIEEKALVLDELLPKQTWTELPDNDALHFDQANPAMQESNAKKIDLAPLMALYRLTLPPPVLGAYSLFKIQ